jgi:hypothetical protein
MIVFFLHELLEAVVDPRRNLKLAWIYNTLKTVKHPIYARSLLSPEIGGTVTCQTFIMTLLKNSMAPSVTTLDEPCGLDWLHFSRNLQHVRY